MVEDPEVETRWYFRHFLGRGMVAIPRCEESKNLMQRFFRASKLCRRRQSEGSVFLIRSHGRRYAGRVTLSGRTVAQYGFKEVGFPISSTWIIVVQFIAIVRFVHFELQRKCWRRIGFVRWKLLKWLSVVLLDQLASKAIDGQKHCPVSNCRSWSVDTWAAGWERSS